MRSSPDWQQGSMQELFRNWVFLQNFWILKFRIWWAAVMWNFPSDWKDWYSHTSSSAGKKRLAYVSFLLNTILESGICLDYSLAAQGSLHLCSHLCTASGVTEAAQCEHVKIPCYPAQVSGQPTSALPSPRLGPEDRAEHGSASIFKHSHSLLLQLRARIVSWLNLQND